MQRNKKKAFTLTELLVVVIVLGTLASVAVPKFTRVLETRKTTEAEEVFSAVRTEQEKRCVLGKKYQTDSTQLEMLAQTAPSQNYVYGLTGTGITASSSKGYQLKMLSYKNGLICCEGEYCDRLNKSYRPCASLIIPEDECASDSVVDPEPPVLTCSESSRPIAQQACGNCGSQSREVTCDTTTGKWKTGDWTSCGGEGVCTPGAPIYDSEGCDFGQVVKRCDESCQWVIFGDSCCRSNRTLVDSYDIPYPGAGKMENSCGGSYFSEKNRFTCSSKDKGKTCNEYVMSTRTSSTTITTTDITGYWTQGSGCCSKRNGSCPPTKTCPSSISYTTGNNVQIVSLPSANDACKKLCVSGRCGSTDGTSASCSVYASQTVNSCTPYYWDGTELGRVYQYTSATLHCTAEKKTTPGIKTQYHVDVYEVSCCI